VPEVAAGEYVVVHVGFAIGKIEESEARQVFELLEKMGELRDLGVTETPPGIATPQSSPDRARRAAGSGRH
jgi:hypothetical protein